MIPARLATVRVDGTLSFDLTTLSCKSIRLWFPIAANLRWEPRTPIARGVTARF